MTLDFVSAIEKNYKITPVSKTFIPSNKSGKQQILWVGCSDSLILETETLAVDAEEIFVHRNLGNIVSNGDLSSKSAIEWSLNILKVCKLGPNTHGIGTVAMLISPQLGGSHCHLRPLRLCFDQGKR